jgi:phenylalanyl-tRNA synthetase alpha chain
MNNINKSIQEKRKLKLHKKENHPIFLIKELIYKHFDDFEKFDGLSEIVTIKNNFDDLLVPKNHSSRRTTDTYYVDDKHVLRSATSAHQNELMKKGYKQFVVTGDVYRKDTIDRFHYPVFHQMEGVKITENNDPMKDLISTLNGMIEYLFPGSEYRILDDYFPFTNPSIQYEVKMGDEWVEICGAGAIQKQILDNCGIIGKGWAFGIGLDRLAMKLCNIPDIRYLWSNDIRFLSQFKNGLTEFQPYSKYPSTHRDISFWVNKYEEDEEEKLWIEHNNLCTDIRDISTDLIQDISLLDKFTKGDRTSLMYRITYQTLSRTLENDEINEIQNKIRKLVEEKYDVILR